MASDPVTAAARSADGAIQAASDLLPAGGSEAKNFFTQLQGLIQKASAAHEGRVLAERRVEELRAHLEQSHSFADAEVKVAIGTAEERTEGLVTMAQVTAGIRVTAAQEETAAAQAALAKQGTRADKLAKEVLQLRGELGALRAEKAQGHFSPQKRDPDVLSEQTREIASLSQKITEQENIIKTLQMELYKLNNRSKDDVDQFTEELTSANTRIKELENHLSLAKKGQSAAEDLIAHLHDMAAHLLYDFNRSKLRHAQNDQTSGAEKTQEVHQLNEQLRKESEARKVAEKIAIEGHQEMRTATAKAAADEREKITNELLSEGASFAQLFMMMKDSGVDITVDDPAALVETVSRTMLIALTHAAKLYGEKSSSG